MERSKLLRILARNGENKAIMKLRSSISTFSIENLRGMLPSSHSSMTWTKQLFEHLWELRSNQAFQAQHNSGLEFRVGQGGREIRAIKKNLLIVEGSDLMDSGQLAHSGF
jgi:hypothetical protein